MVSSHSAIKLYACGIWVYIIIIRVVGMDAGIQSATGLRSARWQSAVCRQSLGGSAVSLVDYVTVHSTWVVLDVWVRSQPVNLSTLNGGSSTCVILLNLVVPGQAVRALLRRSAWKFIWLSCPAFQCHSRPSELTRGSIRHLWLWLPINVP